MINKTILIFFISFQFSYFVCQNNDSRWNNIPKVVDYKEMNMSNMGEIYLFSLENTTRETSLFLQDKWSFSDKLKFQIGLRGTDYSLHQKFYLDPRVGVKYHYNEDIAIKLNWGIYHQFLTTANNQDENLRLVELWLGIPEDKSASVSEHIIGGLEYMSSNNIFYRVELYQKQFDNHLYNFH